MSSADYSTALVASMSPELKARLAILADSEKISLGDMIVKILREGVSTPAFMVAAGAATPFFAAGC